MARKSTQPSNSPREPFGVRLDPEVVIAIKILAAKKKTQVNLLIEESIKDLLRKNGEI
jgi:predicted HicB family RNase H-like nuclease